MSPNDPPLKMRFIGPELDVRVATEIMGWCYDARWKQIVPPEQQLGPNEMWSYSRITTDHRLVFAPGFTVRGITYTPERTILIPPFSTDIAAAWSVLTKLNVWPVRIDQSFHVDESPLGWSCAIAEVKMYAETLPKAICLAALEVQHARCHA